MYYTRLLVTCNADYAEILTAELAEAGFDTFMETETGIEAYGEEGQVDGALVESIRQKYEHVQPLLFSQDRVPKENWNEAWEKNVEPIVVDNQCLVRAHFHAIDKQYPYEIVITPKMSFGTGHHQTTYLMLKSQLAIDHRDKRVMDAGCGTAILSIMACKLGARHVEAFDIDEWSVVNGRENAAVNNCAAINVAQGKLADLHFAEAFDIVLANINKNVLLSELSLYADHLTSGGLLLLSGFYETDVEDLLAEARCWDFSLCRQDSRESWATVLLQKG